MHRNESLGPHSFLIARQSMSFRVTIQWMAFDEIDVWICPYVKLYVVAGLFGPCYDMPGLPAKISVSGLQRNRALITLRR